jgi:arylsulfatase A-like enzyme
VDGSFGAIEDAPAVDGEGNGWQLETGWRKPPRKMGKDPKFGWMTPDKINAHLMADILAGKKDDLTEPFFMGVGFVRPHTPLHVEKRFFEQHPLSKLKTEPRKSGDADDTFWKDFNDREKSKGYRYFDLLRESYDGTDEGLSAFSQAYLASVSAVDQNVDTVLTALDNSPYRDNTIVVLTSDHGWQMGEKQWLFKGSPWEESCRVPMIIRVPGMTKSGSRCDQPVSLIDLYPTLVDLCGLTGSTVRNESGRPLDGHSMRPLLEDPVNGKWDGPEIAVTTFHVQPPKGSGRDWRAEDNHFSVRSRRYRYIRYNDGREELYDHDHDPYEWTNVAADPAMAKVKRRP